MTQNSNEFLWNVHGYINDYIKFADTKASAVIAWAGAFIGTLVATKSYRHFLDRTLFALDLLAWVTFLAFVLLVLAFLASIVVVAPYLKFDKKAKQGFIYWESIRQFSSGESYAAAVAKNTDLDSRIAQHVYELAGIARRKFRLVNWGIWLAAAGSLFGIVSVFSE